VDVAVVGGGFTGLWTAYALGRADPGLRVVVLEKELVGFGASGRNGGWASALFATGPGRLARRYGVAEIHRLRRSLQEAIDEIGRVASTEGIDCGFAKDGTLVAARSAAQVARARAELAEARELGIPEADLRWLDSPEAALVLAMTGVQGATFTPHCAAIHPGRLVRGLARAVERQGTVVYEQTPVLGLIPGNLRSPYRRRPVLWTTGGTVRAETVVLATEAFTAQFPGLERRLVPVYSLVIATEPLAPELLGQIAAGSRPTFADHRNLIIYGQITADGRVVFGGRGAPYHLRSGIDPAYDHHPRVHRKLEATLRDLFPVLANARITHRWGGPVGVPRDWHPSVGHEPRTGLAWAGGYVGDGVTTTNLAGRTLADLILGVPSELTSLCWVGHCSPPWEPEPLRFLGVNAGLLAANLADQLERRTGRPSRVSSLVAWLTGH